MAKVAEFTTTISPQDLAHARGEVAGSNFTLDTEFSPETRDPHGVYNHKSPGDFILPSQAPLFRVEIHSETGGDSYITIRPEKGGESQTFPLMPRYRLTREDIQFAQTNALVVHPVVADAVLYFGMDGCVQNYNSLPGGQIEFGNVDQEGSRRVIDFLSSGGVKGAEFLDIQSALPEGADLSGFFAHAVWMDTACRTNPKIDPQGNLIIPGMSAKMIREAFDWTHKNVQPGTSLWMGTGSEFAPLDTRVEFALRDGKLTYESYVEYRREQLRLVDSLGHVPILFPDQIQNGFHNNAGLINDLLSTFLGKIVLHKLGTPFAPPTDYLDIEVLKATAGQAFAVKSSHPSFGKQMEDNNAIRAGSAASGRPVVMHTGDDRGFAGDFFAGVAAQAKAGLPDDASKFITRNGYTFLNDQNVSALLGYLGLNPYQSIVAIIKLSQFFHEVINGRPESPRANQCLKDFWNLMAPAMLLSQRSFFGPYQATPAYTGFVELSNRFTGVLNNTHGHTLPHRDIRLQGVERQAIARDHLLAHVLSGAIEARELDGVIGNNRSILGL